MAVCVMVATIVGLFCFEGADQVGDCWELGPGDPVVCYVEDPTTIPIWGSPYDPALGGINCVDPCDQLGDGTAVSDAYGWAAACPLGWYGHQLHLVQLGQVWDCRDHGGDIRPSWGERFICGQDGLCQKTAVWTIVVDFLVPLADGQPWPDVVAGPWAWEFTE